MIRHVVLVRFRADVPEAERAAIRDGLRDLPAGRPGGAAEYGAFAWGQDASPEGLQRGYHTGFTIDFADAAARDAYLVDPGHRAMAARLVAAAEGGVDGLLVVDLVLG